MNNSYAIWRASRFTLPPPVKGAEEVELAPDRVALGALIGRIPGFFDLSVYAIASALVFPRLFFPMVSLAGGLVFAFAVLSLAFLVRPLGARLFDRLQQRFGRTAKLAAAAFCLAICSGAIGLMGGYALLGPAAIVLLVLFRCGQGLALAGLGQGLVSPLALTPSASNGLWRLVPRLAAPIGVLMAVGLMAYGAAGLSRDEFVAWGWRFPFLIAAAVNLVALLARLRLAAAERVADFAKTR